MAALDTFFEAAFDAPFFGVLHGDLEAVAGAGTEGVGAVSASGVTGFGEEGILGDAFTDGFFDVAFDLALGEAVPRRSARLFVFDKADSGGAESKSEDSSGGMKGSVDTESKPLDSIGCVFGSIPISGEAIGDMTVGAREDAEVGCGDKSVSILRFVLKSAPVASPALVNDGHAPVSPNVSTVAGGIDCSKVSTSAAACRAPLSNEPGISEVGVSSITGGTTGGGIDDSKICLSSFLIGEDSGVASFDLRDSAIDLAVGDTAPHTDESVSPILETEFRLLVVPELSVGGDGTTAFSFPLYDDLPREGSLETPVLVDALSTGV